MMMMMMMVVVVVVVVSCPTFSDLWEPLYGVLWHLKVHSVQHDIPRPVRRIAKSELYDVSWLL